MTPADQLLRDLRDYVSTIRKGLATSWDADNAMLKRIDAHLSTNAATQASPSVALTESSLEDAVKPVVAAPQSPDIARAESPECPWVQDGDAPDTFDTGCGKRFTIIDGTPFDNDMTFCCYCGDPIVQALHTPEITDDN
jgi:hypothetical protein